MKLRFYTNAAMQIMAGNVNILCDPWLIPGAFDGSWWHYPRLEIKPEDLVDYTHLYISHIHPDHCDLATLRRLRNKDVPVILLKRNGEVFLRKRLESCGFKRFVEISNGESCVLDPGVVITMYEAFASSVFIANAETPNVIDSSFVLSHKGQTIFNANDNIPSPDDCLKIVDRHGKPTLALLPYCGVGPWPSSYPHIPLESRKHAAHQKAQQYLKRLVENAKALGAERVIPCAGQMILGGKLYYKNELLGCAQPQDAADALSRENIPVSVLWEQDEYDTETGLKSDAGLGPQGKLGLTKIQYLEQIKGDLYPWQTSFRIMGGDCIELIPLVQVARKRLASYQERYPYNKEVNGWWVALRINETPRDVLAFQFDPRGSETSVRKLSVNEFFSKKVPFLMVDIPYNYLLAILTRHGHWNNAFHGCQVDWLRSPDEYHPDIQTLLSYFHI